ncbi:MAG: diguanylate cyclase [Bacillota bacterium]
MPLRSLRAQVVILLVIVLVVYTLAALYATTSILKSCVPDATGIRHMIQTLMLSKIIVLAGLLVILSLFISLAFSRWLSPLNNISNTLTAIAKGDYDRPIDPPCYAEFQGIAEAAERMRLDIKETFNRLNNLSNFGMRAVSLVKEEEAYQLLVHYLKRMGVDETIIVSMEEGHRRARVTAYYSRPAQKECYFSEPVSSFNLPVLKAVELCRAVRVLTPYVVNDVGSDLMCRFGCATDPEIKSYVCFPLAVGGRALGWVKTSSHTPHFFKPEMRKEIEGYVSITAAMISNLRLSELNRHLSLTDPLTTLYNRRFFAEYFERLVAEANRRQEPFSVLFLDIDQFKNINDTYGHEIGDQVLATTARTIKEILREMDLMIRYGGEEFVIVLPGTDLKGGITVAEKIRRTIATTPVFLDSGENIFLTVSMGVAEYKPGARYTSEEVIQQADEAMYQAKLNGKNLVVAYQENGGGRASFRPQSQHIPGNGS